MTPTETVTPYAADLVIDIKPAEMNAEKGTPVEIKISVRNIGGSTADGVIITEQIPPEMKFATGPGLNIGWTVSGGVATYNAGSIAAGEQLLLSLYLEPLVAETASGMITIPAASVDYTSPATDPSGTVLTAVSTAKSVWIGSIKVFPNPFNPSTANQGRMQFINLPYGSRVVIYTVSGEQVVQYAAINQGTAYWYGNNTSGSPVSAGIYYYVIYTVDSKVIQKDVIFVTRN